MLGMDQLSMHHLSDDDATATIAALVEQGVVKRPLPLMGPITAEERQQIKQRVMGSRLQGVQPTLQNIVVLGDGIMGLLAKHTHDTLVAQASAAAQLLRAGGAAALHQAGGTSAQLLQAGGTPAPQPAGTTALQAGGTLQRKECSMRQFWSQPNMIVLVEIHADLMAVLEKMRAVMARPALEGAKAAEDSARGKVVAAEEEGPFDLDPLELEAIATAQVDREPYAANLTEREFQDEVQQTIKRLRLDVNGGSAGGGGGSSSRRSSSAAAAPVRSPLKGIVIGGKRKKTGTPPAGNPRSPVPDGGLMAAAGKLADAFTSSSKMLVESNMAFIKMQQQQHQERMETKRQLHKEQVEQRLQDLDRQQNQFHMKMELKMKEVDLQMMMLKKGE